MNFNSTFKLSLRSIKRDKTFSIINIIGLSLGLVSCAFVFLYSYHALTFDQYHDDYKSIHRINSSWVGTAENRSMAITAPAVAHSLKADYSYIESAGIISAMNDRQTLTIGENDFELHNFREGDRGVLDVFSFNLLSGTKTNQGIYINDEWAHKLFGKIDCVGKSVSIGKSNYQISGVFEKWPQNVDLPIEGLMISDFEAANKEAMGYVTYIKTTVEPQTLKKDLAVLSEKLYGMEVLLETVPLEGLHFQKSIVGDMPKGNKTYTYLALSTAIILVIIVLINISNLSIIRGMDAIRMNGIRKILGASSAHIQWYQMVQLITLFGISSFIAITLFQMTSPYFKQVTGIYITGNHLPFLGIFGFSFLLLILLIGIYAQHMSIKINPVNALKNQISNKLSGSIIRKGLVVFQFVITGLVISSLLILITQWDYIKTKDLGFNTENIAVISLQKRNVDAKILKTQISSIVDEENISLGTWGTMPGSDIPFTTASIEESQLEFPVNVIDYDPNFLNVFEINLMQGSVPDVNVIASDQPQPILINQTLGNMLEEPIESTVGLVWMKGKVSGVIADYNYQSLHNEIQPLILMPQAKESRHTRVFVKIPSYKMTELQEIVSESLASGEITLEYLDQILLENYQQEKEAISLIFYFALISFFISILGIMGVVSYILKKREFEIGIRKVLGASLSHLCTLFGSEVMVLLVLAGVICLPVAFLLKEQILGLYAFQANIQWWYFLLPTVVIVLISMSVVFYQIIKAGQVDPVKLLKDD